MKLKVVIFRCTGRLQAGYKSAMSRFNKLAMFLIAGLQPVSSDVLDVELAHVLMYIAGKL